MKDIFDLNSVSKTTIERNKRIEKQKNEYLKNHDAMLRESLEAEEREKTEKAMSAARLGYASTFTRAKNRVNNLKEEIEYTNNALTVAMTETITKVVLESLLVDHDEYSKLNEDYVDDIRDIVRNLLENADINENITDTRTLTIMENISSMLPDAKTGKYLSEDRISSIVNNNKNINVLEAIKSLSGNISSRVAALVEKEQQRINEIEEEMEKTNATKKDKDNKNEKPKDVEDNYEEDNYDDETDLYVEDDYDDEEELDDDDNDIEIQDLPKRPEVKLEITPEGGAKIQIKEMLIRETPRSGLLETLAVNEAQNMLNEGKEYNSDLCIANALTYITITEAMSEMGLLKVTENEYSKIIK